MTQTISFIRAGKKTKKNNERNIRASQHCTGLAAVSGSGQATEVPQAVKYCRCIKTIQGVNLRSIADVKVHGPRPYCRKQEVIVILKNGRSHCLDPEVKFTRILVQRTQT
uniref:Chemokine interleukin-8-like domain-containing protein n=1 Tax=Acanthochromis polyacanthus TaxID=80966 RepID=A0A3Q1EP21_9TELE